MTQTDALQPHPLADLFPLMAADELQRLADDIKANGLRDPIVTLGGQILDGRNRYKACRMAGVEPKAEVFCGTDPVAFVVSKNLHRRHLNESQRALVAASLANMKLGENQHKTGYPDLGTLSQPVTIPKAAEMLTVSTGNVDKAKRVQRDGVPELVERVKAGEVTLNAAEMVATLPAGEQEELIEQGPEVVKARATEIRKGRQKAKQQRPEPEERPAAKPKRLRGVGVFMANDALNILHKIPGDDPELAEAVQIISSWVARQRKGR